MRVSEWIQVLAFAFLIALVWIRPLPLARRLRVTGLGVLGLSATLAAAFVAPDVIPSAASSILRDWLPCLMMPLVYWQAGEFFLCANSDLQQLLVETDRIVVGPVVGWISRLRTRRWIAGILETAYLLCYPTIPMSVGVCYLLHIRRSLDYFWAVVLLSTYVSYIALAFFQTLPPRMLPEPWLKRLPPNPVRALNLWILAKASTHVNTFPSAHVAASMAIALALLRLAPWPAGVVFLGLALTIAIAAFLGRYHFVLDAVTGTIIAILIFSGVTAAGVLHGT